MRYVISFVIFLSTGPLAAQELLSFDVEILGVNVGEISISGHQHNDNYSARARFVTTGFVKALKRMHGDVTVHGRVMGGALAPRDYFEAIDEGKRVTNVKVRFGGGFPQLVSGDTGSRAAPADTSKLGHARDPLTILFELLRDQPRDGLCAYRADVFDGHRHARVALGQPKTSGETARCSGYYWRIAGYSSSEKKKRPIPVTIEYARAGDSMRASRVWLDTKYGKAQLLRR